MGQEFLQGSLAAERALTVARERHERARARADARLAAARERHARELAVAARIEAQAWRELMAVPGMTIATAATIGDITPRAVHAWLNESVVQAPCS